MLARCLVGLSVSPLGAQSTVVELSEGGWKARRDGHEARSEAFFAEALTLRPNDPVLLFGAAAAAHAQGKQREAMARLQVALERNPRLTDASRLLGRIAYEEGEVDQFLNESGFETDPTLVLNRLERVVRRPAVEIRQHFHDRRRNVQRIVLAIRADPRHPSLDLHEVDWSYH